MVTGIATAMMASSPIVCITGQVDSGSQPLQAAAGPQVDNITRLPTIVRDLAMIKVSATSDARTQVIQLVDVNRPCIVDVSAETLVIETTVTEDKIDSLLDVLRPYAVIEMVRTGRVEMARGTAKAVTVGPSRGIGDGPTRSKRGRSAVGIRA